MKSFSIPNITFLRLEQADIIVTSGVTSVNGNGGINYGGPGHGTRTPGRQGILD